MKNILIISSTKSNNYLLSKNLCDLIDDGVNKNNISLEDYPVPLFVASTYEDSKVKYKDIISKITDELVNADGIIFCAPEYNGSIPPILTNMIAWISVSTEYWRDGFSDKIALIATHSGGPANKFNIALKNQLEHLGMIVMPRYISVTSTNPLNTESTRKILQQFLKHL
tara:strand:- start:9 stop:515 length:507 start_codon:yes stop_codon:yes gene_type:complete